MGHAIGKSSTEDLQKLSPIIGLLITTLFSLLLVAEHIRGWVSDENFVATISDNRTTVAIAVQLVSHALGLMHIFALCSAWNLSFRHEIRSRPFSLDAARFINAIYSLRLDRTLPWPLLSALAGFIALSFVPASIWAGAITPITLDNHNLTRAVGIPSLANITDIDIASDNNATSLDYRGLFSFDMNEFRPLILNGAKDASSVAHVSSNDTASNPKLDKTGFSYIGRSYGVGSMAGILSVPDVKSPLRYSYQEQGFQASISCTKNESAAYSYHAANVASIAGYPVVEVYIRGKHPDNVPARNVSQVGYAAWDFLGWDLAYADKSSSVMVTTSASKSGRVFGETVDKGINADQYGFADFNATQCRVDWAPRAFNVDVNNTAKTIAVTVGEPANWPAYGDMFIRNVTRKLADFTYLDGSFGGSMLGRAMRMNTNNLQQRDNATSAGAGDVVLRSLEDFIAYAYDSGIVAMSSSLAVLGNATEQVDAAVSVQAIIYGSPTYVYSIFGINAFVCLVYAVEALRTRGWKLVSPVDFLDVASIVVAASRGGIGVAESMDKSVMRVTDGDMRRAVGAVKVQVDGGGAVDYSVALVPGAAFVERGGDSQHELLLRTTSSTTVGR